MPYRDDRHALETRRDDLRRELVDLDAKADALRDVLRVRDAVARDLAATEARLADLDARRARPIDVPRRTEIAVYAAAGVIGASIAMAALSPVRMTVGAVRVAQQEMVGELPLGPDTYVPVPPHHFVSRGPVLTYHEDATPDRPATDWTLFSDATVMRSGLYETQPLADPRALDAAHELTRLANELRPEAMGAVPAFADSAVPRTYEVYSTGIRRATHADRARIFELCSRIHFAGGGTTPAL
jgi:hypothetical protein